jgi:nitrogen fixation protein NifX
MMERGYLKVAMTTNSLLQVDADFISARQMVIYEVTEDKSEFIDCLQFAPGAKGGRKGKGPGGGRGCCGDDMDDGKSTDRVTAMIEALNGCSVLFTTGLSDLQAMRVQDARVFPVKMERSRDITEVIERLQVMLAGDPPLWMVRALKGRADHKRAGLGNSDNRVSGFSV